MQIQYRIDHVKQATETTLLRMPQRKLERERAACRLQLLNDALADIGAGGRLHVLRAQQNQPGPEPRSAGGLAARLDGGHRQPSARLAGKLHAQATQHTSISQERYMCSNGMSCKASNKAYQRRPFKWLSSRKNAGGRTSTPRGPCSRTSASSCRFGRGCRPGSRCPQTHPLTNCRQAREQRGGSSRSTRARPQSSPLSRRPMGACSSPWPCRRPEPPSPAR